MLDFTGTTCNRYSSYFASSPNGHAVGLPGTSSETLNQHIEVVLRRVIGFAVATNIYGTLTADVPGLRLEAREHCDNLITILGRFNGDN